MLAKAFCRPYLGLLVNFGAELLKHGITRIINGTIEDPQTDVTQDQSQDY